MEIQSFRLIKPFKKATILNITQSFHATHEALDIVAPYGTPLVAPEACAVIGLWGDEHLSDDTDGLERGYGLKLKGLSTGFTHIYWHTNPVFPVSLNDIVGGGQIIAFMGNAGNVNHGGKYVPLSERHVAPYRGTHLHQELWAKNGKRVNPAVHIDWYNEPLYNTKDWLAAWFKVLAKMGKMISK